MNGVNSDLCPVCTFDLYEKKKQEINPIDIVLQTPCGHKYHAGCIQEWRKIKPICPSCDGDLSNWTEGKQYESALLLTIKNCDLVAAKYLLNAHTSFGIPQETLKTAARALVQLTSIKEIEPLLNDLQDQQLKEIFKDEIKRSWSYEKQTQLSNTLLQKLYSTIWSVVSLILCGLFYSLLNLCSSKPIDSAYQLQLGMKLLCSDEGKPV